MSTVLKNSVDFGDALRGNVSLPDNSMKTHLNNWQDVKTVSYRSCYEFVKMFIYQTCNAFESDIARDFIKSFDNSLLVYQAALFVRSTQYLKNHQSTIILYSNSRSQLFC